MFQTGPAYLNICISLADSCWNYPSGQYYIYQHELTFLQRNFYFSTGATRYLTIVHSGMKVLLHFSLSIHCQ